MTQNEMKASSMITLTNKSKLNRIITDIRHQALEGYNSLNLFGNRGTLNDPNPYAKYIYGIDELSELRKLGYTITPLEGSAFHIVSW